ncbi:MAG: hypothetical protein POELPBGB_00235 [Bacteroidia bacterium]|nr:hypothetical protein [Bacteroidia bacterium]
MKKSLLIILFSILFSISYAQKKGAFILESQFKDFVPISPLEYDQKVIVIDTLGRYDTLSVKQLAVSKRSILNFLPNEAVFVSVKKNDMSGSISYGPASVTAESGSYSVTVDYCKFTTLKIFNSSGTTCDGFTKVGVGLRITANVQTTKAGLNLGNLFGLGLAAQMNKLSGTMSIDVIGMESQEITTLIPLPSEISPTSIQNALQAMATIKSKIYDNSTRLYPQIVAVKRSEGDCSVNDFIKKIGEDTDVQPVGTIYLDQLQQQQLQQPLQQQQRQQQIQQQQEWK